ncbi:MAG: hypothetical protein U0350_51790 [Caldilineaceae bacterium]
MQREQVYSVLEKIGPVHHKLAGMISNMNLAVEMFDSLSPTEQVQLNLYWQNAHQEAIQRLQESFAYLVEANAALGALSNKSTNRQ